MPRVSLAIPSLQQRWPYRAACWSPTLAPITARPPQARGSVTASRPAVPVTDGNIAAGMPNRSSRTGSQADAARLNSMVRAAIDGSVACTRPPLRFQVSQELTSPNNSSPAAARRRAPGTEPSSQESLAALNAGCSGSPVRSRTSGS